MPQKFATLSALRAHGFDTLIDVRSPTEYAEDHVPGAISLPVLSDDERATVGTIYTQEAPFKARKIGAALVARNAALHIEGPLEGKDGAWRPLVYCWRGGQRSGSFTSILQQIGWRADVIDGGYRSYRRLVVAAMHDTALPHRLILIDGNTGTAKTEILHRLAARGTQIVDLEGLAAHRGSVFGPVTTPQPSQKAFEGALADAFDRLDPAVPVVVEAESSKIGNVAIPPSVWAAMRAGPRLFLGAPLAARARYLTTAYADMVDDPAVLQHTLGLLIPFHGHDQIDAWREMADSGQYELLAYQLMERHYDPRYTKSRSNRDGGIMDEIALNDLKSDDLNRATDAIMTRIKAGQRTAELAEKTRPDLGPD